MAQATTLEGPYEWLELDDKQDVTIYPLDYTFGTVSITPKNKPEGFSKQIQALRLKYDKDPKVPGLDTIDISSQTLIAQIGPALKNIITNRQGIHITAFGEAPKKRFTVEIVTPEKS